MFDDQKKIAKSLLAPFAWAASFGLSCLDIRVVLAMFSGVHEGTISGLSRAVAADRSSVRTSIKRLERRFLVTSVGRFPQLSCFGDSLVWNMAQKMQA